jgi:hypothetical protein
MDNRDLTTDVLIPAVQAGITGVILGMSAGVIAYLAHWEHPGAFLLGGWVVFTAIGWLVFVGRAWRLVERVLGADPAPGFIAHTDAPQQMTQVELLGDQGGDYLKIPLDTMRLIAIAYQLEHGASFSHALSGPGRPISRGEYERLRDYFLARGLARWVSPGSRKDGLELSRGGQSLVRYYASMVDDPPTLTEGGKPINQ